MALTNEINVMNKDEIVNALQEGTASDVADMIIENIKRNNEAIQNRIIEEAKTFNVKNADEEALARRGIMPLTSDERNFYNEAKEKGSFGTAPLPRTIFERVFEELKQNHELLSKILFVNTTGISDWVLRKGEVAPAWWGPLTEEIKKKLEGEFEVVSTTQNKVSAYIPVSKDMLNLSVEWLDKYIRVLLGEAIARAFEDAIVAGDGKDKPVGMTRKLADVTGGIHAEKTAVKLKDFKPSTIGKEILAPLSQGKDTTIGEVILLINPTTYYSKMYGIMNIIDQYGRFVKQDLPFNGTIVLSAAVPEDRIVAGEARRYFLGVGSTLKIESSDEYRFIEDQRVYLAKQYATGRATTDADFLVFDIADWNK
ncbi:MAG: phage major capsid protein [[Eubacterium] sulci]|jgi:phage capsid family|nr:phage major capsid protein [[Eubacterium] sulci]DAT04033.1 MAG TPA: major capsid protein [Caudoviricetes sp.]